MPKPPRDTCGCDDDKEHERIVAAVNESYKQDDARARMRQERNSYALRAKVLAEVNGKHAHTID